jgi:hypothetical protein
MAGKRGRKRGKKRKHGTGWADMTVGKRYGRAGGPAQKLIKSRVTGKMVKPMPLDILVERYNKLGKLIGKRGRA